MEDWKTIEGYPNYEISTGGRVRNRSTGRIRASSDDSRGYPAVSLWAQGRPHTKNVHRLVAETFIPNPDGKTTVNHIDGNKRNNHISNLEWNTVSENVKHAYVNGLKVRPDNCGSPKRSVRIVETGEVFDSIGDCARAINGNQAHISNCLSGRYHTHKGYHFEDAPTSKEGG